MPKLTKRIILKKPFRLLSIIFLLGGLLYLLSFWISLVPADKTDYSGLDSYIMEEMNQKLVPGLSLVIFNGRKTSYSKGYGVKNAKTGDLVDRDTVFQGASFSKVLTAYAALILVERGELSLDKPLDKYLKRAYLPSQKAANQITLRMVLNHTSGLSNESDGKDRRVYFSPGAYFSYSGAGFRYLQQVMEDVTGMHFAEFMDQTVMKPLKMESSSFVWRDDLIPLMANGHEAGIVFPLAEKKGNAAYSLLTTPEDMAKFCKEIFQPKLLKTETAAQMTHPMVKWHQDIYWGLGIGVVKTLGEDFIWHWGNNYYYCSLMFAGKNSKAGVIIMTNGNTGMRLAIRLGVKIMNDYFVTPGQNIAPETFDLIL